MKFNQTSIFSIDYFYYFRLLFTSCLYLLLLLLCCCFLLLSKQAPDSRLWNRDNCQFDKRLLNIYMHERFKCLYTNSPNLCQECEMLLLVDSCIELIQCTVIKSKFHLQNVIHSFVLLNIIIL